VLIPTLPFPSDLILELLISVSALVKGLDGFMAFSLCFTTVAIIPSISTAFTMALEGSGPFYIVWTWIFASIFTVTVGLSMAEICSVHLGSVYIWTGHLAPPAWAPVMSYVCGWFNFVGNTFSV
jgi:amino acid transporter